LQFRKGTVGIVIIVLLLSLHTQTGAAYTVFRTFDIASIEIQVGMISCKDGGLAIGGYSYFYSPRGYEFVLIKTDQNGYLEWIQTYGTSNNEYMHSLTECADGGFLLVGKIASGQGWILRIDSYGRQLWNHTFNPESVDYLNLYDIKELPSGEIIAAGNIKEEGSDHYDAWLVRLDSNGTLISSTTFNNASKSETCKSLILCQNGDIMMVGSSGGYQDFGIDFWMMRLSISEDVIWEKSFCELDHQHFSSAKETHDGGFVLTGTWEVDTFGPWDFSMYVVRTDSSGDLLWNRNYTGSEEHLGPDDSRLPEDTSGEDIIECDDNGLAIVGATNSYANYFPKNIWLVRTDEFGNPIWNNTVKRDSQESPKAMVQSYTGRFIVLSETKEREPSSEDDTLLVFINDINPLNETTTPTTPNLSDITTIAIASIVGIGLIAVFTLSYNKFGKRKSVNNL